MCDICYLKSHLFRLEVCGLKDDNWIQKLKEKRLVYGISQNRLAVTAGIRREYLNRIENHKVQVPEDVKVMLMKTLDKLNPDASLEMLFDYVRIRFPTLDVESVITYVLGLKLEFMVHEDYGFYSYSEHYVYGDIFILVSKDIEKGVLIELKGKGCRQFESFLLAQHRSWFDFFVAVSCFKGVFKRVDLAINDKIGILDIPELTKKCTNEECISVFRTFKSYRSGELVRRDEKQDMGNTLYIGSLKSEVYFCIYEKDYEQYIKNDIPIAEADVKNRFEIRLKNERAFHAVCDLMAHNDAEKTAFDIINRYIRFVDRVDGKRRSEWKMNDRWAWFLGNDRKKLKLTTKPEPYNYEKTLNWLERQVAPTLKIAIKLDQIKGTDIVEDMIKNANVTQKHFKILEQQAVPIEEIVKQTNR